MAVGTAKVPATVSGGCVNLFVRVLILLALCAWPAQAMARTTSRTVEAGPQRTDRIEAELVPMSAWAAPGSTAVVAVKQTIRPGWHTYWRNPGDSGGATSLAWSLPQGVRAGDIVWPVPERQRLSGLMNYGYSGEVYLAVPIEVPATARAGTVLPLTVEASFFVCSAEMCVPEDLTLRLALPIREGAAPLDRRHGEAITAVLETAPRPAGIEARIAAEDGALILGAAGGPLAGRNPGPSYFFPFEKGIIDHAAVQTGAWGPQGLTLRLQPGGDVRAAGLSGPVEGVLVTAHGAWEIRAEPGAAPAATSGSGELAAAAEGAAGPDPVEAPNLAGFAQALLFAVLGGLILNLMPCVFPILALKALHLARSGGEEAAARRDSLAYAAGAILGTGALGLALLAIRAGGSAVGWAFQLQDPRSILLLTLLATAITLNLLRAFELPVVAGEASPAGSFGTGALAAFVATPCAGPFLGAALGTALLLPAAGSIAVFAMLGLGLALPFVAVAFIPALRKRLPRPGPWMARLQRILAVPMALTVLGCLWLLWRLGGTSGLIAGLVSLALLVTSLVLAGRSQKRGQPAVGLAVILLLVAAVVPIVGLGRGEVAVAARPAPGTEAWSVAAVARAQAAGKPAFVYFTADWCITCKANEAAAINRGSVRDAFRKAGVVTLVGDWTNGDPAITRLLESQGRAGVPLYLWYEPGKTEPEELPQVLTPGLLSDRALRPRQRR